MHVTIGEIQSVLKAMLSKGLSMRRGKVVIYGKKDCMACLRVKQIAEIYGFDFEYRDIGNPEELKEMMKHTQVPLVPLAIWNGKAYQGYEAFSEAVENQMNDYGDGVI